MEQKILTLENELQISEKKLKQVVDGARQVEVKNRREFESVLNKLKEQIN